MFRKLEEEEKQHDFDSNLPMDKNHKLSPLIS